MCFTLRLSVIVNMIECDNPLLCRHHFFDVNVSSSSFSLSEPSSSFDAGDTGSFDEGLRRRNVPSFDAPRPRTSDEEDEEDEMEFKLTERKEEKPWFSLNKCIVGALILLFLGSLFLSG